MRTSRKLGAGEGPVLPGSTGPIGDKRGHCQPEVKTQILSCCQILSCRWASIIISTPGRPVEDIMTMTRDEIISVLGPADDALIAEIAATGSTIEELREAFAWIGADEALVNEGRSLPSPRVAILIDLIDPPDDEE
jgi:hypothetical protein